METRVPGFHGLRGLHSAQDESCPCCGLSAEQLTTRKLLGCSECYAAFKLYLEPLREFLLGSPEKPAGRRQEKWRRLRRMNLMLEEAVLLENFEEAAILRDKIRRARARGNAP